MAGDEESCCSFQWDDESKLYYHSGSGFYHDPDAGWYYRSRDGLYYTFRNGNYVLMESDPAYDGVEDHHLARSLSVRLGDTTVESSTELVNWDGFEIFHNQHLNVETTCFRLEETLINLT